MSPTNCAFALIVTLGLLVGLENQARGQHDNNDQLAGIVTLMDTNRGLLVIQNDEQSRAIKLAHIPSEIAIGERIVINGKAEPYFTTCPDYPNHPSGSSVLPTFETPHDWGDHFLARLRGFLRVPADGNYTFWVVADDEGELMLGTNSDPATAKQIAQVRTATRLGEWDRDPEQKSQPVFLKAGERYYIEALHREWRGHDYLVVAWKGPGFERRVITDANLSPWDTDTVTSGILREFWTNSFLTRLAMLSPQVQEEGIFRVDDAKIKLLGKAGLPPPQHLSMDHLSGAENFSHVEIDGVVSFAALDNGELTVELMEPKTHADNLGASLRVRVLDCGDFSTANLLNRKVRVRGVYERVIDTKGEQKSAIIWVQNMRQLTLLEFAESDTSELKLLPIFELSPANLNLAWGRKVMVRGTVMSCDTNFGILSLRGDDSFHAYNSIDGKTWTPLGSPVPVAMQDPVFVGLVVDSVARPRGTEARFDHLSLDLSKGQCVGLGGVSTNDSVKFDGDSITITPNGGNDWAATDEGVFLCQRMEEDAEIIARLDSCKTTRPSDKAGLMMRASLDPDAPYVALFTRSGTRLDLQYRGAPQAVAKAVDHVTSSPPQWLKLTRHRHTLSVKVLDGDMPQIRQQVELVGVLNWSNGKPVLKDAYVRSAAQAAKKHPATTETRKVRIADLPTDVAASEQYLGENYLIRGVVTFMGRAFNRNLLFIQDDSGGALIRILPEFFRTQQLEPGQLVEVKGEVRFAPSTPPFGLTTGTVLGWGKLPQPASYPEPSALKLADGRWVEANGIVHSVSNNVMMIMERDGLLPVWVGSISSSNALTRYVDSLVTVRGAFSLQIGTGPALLVPSPQFIQASESPPADPFAVPSLSIDKICNQDENDQLRHRIKVSGIVTYRNGESLIIQDESAGALVAGRRLGEANIDDKVEVVGFPELKGGTLTLHDALLRKIGETHSSEPPVMSLNDVLEKNLNYQIVRLDGYVLDQKVREGRQILELQDGQRVFRAVLQENAGRLETLATGSRVRIVGVNQLQFAGPGQAVAPEPGFSLAASINVLMRSPADLQLLERPPWWNWRHTLLVVTILAVVLAASLIWIRMLRRRVEERTRELESAMGRLQKETEISATLAERDRLAAEIHDTFEQGLSGIMMQLEGVDARLLTDPNEAQQFLEKAKRMVGYNRNEVRQSLWNLESTLLQGGNLATAIKEIARQMAAGNGVKVDVEIVGTAQQLQPTVEHHLLRCTQESLNNAFKHAKASRIEVRLNYAERAIELTVTDNGCGFDPDAVLIETGKSLGLRNLRRRSRKIKAMLKIQSQPGHGTTIKLTVPLPVEANKAYAPDEI